MDSQQLQLLAQRFIQLDLEQQKTFLKGMRTQGIEPDVLPIPKRPDSTDMLAPSFSQQRQWFLWQLNPESDAYHIKSSLKLTGQFDLDTVQKSVSYLVNRQTSLRTVFKQDENGVMQQVILKKLDVEVDYSDFRAEVTAEQAAREILSQQAMKPFELSTGPLWRIVVCQVSDDEYHLLVVMHHIISDGWSIEILIQEFMACYQAYSHNSTPKLSPLTIDYADHSYWQQTLSDAGELQQQVDYWQSLFSAEQSVLSLPTDNVRKTGFEYKSATHAFILPSKVTSKLQAMCQKKSMSLFNILLAGFQLLLHKYSGQSQINVGVANAGRTKEEVETLIGFFVNTLVYSSTFEANNTFKNVLEHVNERCLDAQEHQSLPFDLLVDSLNLERSLDHNPLFQVMFNYQVESDKGQLRMENLIVESLNMEEGTAQFDLDLNAQLQLDGSIYLNLSYAKELFEAKTISRLSEHYVEILAGFLDMPDKAIGDISLLNDSETKQLTTWGINDTRYDNTQPVHQLIEKQVELTPDATALVFEDEQLTYTELNQRANQLAHYLIAQGVKPENKVGIAVKRSIDMVVSLLAVLKAGAAFVPLDPNYPSERLAYMIEDSGLSILLSQTELLAQFPQSKQVTIICLDTFTLSHGLSTNPEVSLHHENLAYLIYTSGSTGKPKAVAISHAGFAEHVVISKVFSSLTPSDRMLQFSTINFDGFIEQMFPPLIIGAGIVLRGSELWDADTFYRQLIEKKITIADLPTAYWFMLIQHFAQQGITDYGQLREIHIGGEAMPPEGVKVWLDANLEHVTLLNTYGPTEAIVVVSISDCSHSVIGKNKLPQQMPIGRPLAGRSLYVLDSNLHSVRLGMEGELCIGGELLARGYLGRADLTSSSFIADPFCEKGGRLYRTGDLVRWNQEGELEYLGRIDHQVKIRGFRIELGEIESALLKQAAVSEAVVVAKESQSGTRLVAYVSASADANIDTNELKVVLGQSLPDYMVPSIIVLLDALPLNPNGKIDRKALPEPEFVSNNEYAAPEGEVEAQLAQIWCEVLGLEQVGRHDNFFELGGDSILSLQIVARMRQMGWKISPKQLFEHQTVSALAGVAQSIAGDVGIVSKTSGEVPLLPFQSEFFAMDMPNRHHWNQAVLLHSKRALDIDVLSQAIVALVQQHDGLRLNYSEQNDGSWLQSYADLSSNELSKNELSELLWLRQANNTDEVEALCNEAQRSLDISNGPLLRALAIELPDNSWRVLLVIHHLVVDGVSWRILLGDLQTAYQQIQNKQAVNLPLKSSSYLDWSAALASYPQDNEAEFSYWQELSDVPCALPIDSSVTVGQPSEEKDISLTLSKADTTALLTKAPAAYRTQVNDLLLTALGRALCDWSGDDSILIDLEGHGREDLFDHIDLSNTVGWFTSLYPVALSAQGNIGDAIKRIKENLRSIPNKGLGYGLFKSRGSIEQKTALQNIAKPQVVFNYLGQFDTSFDDEAMWQVADESSGDSVDSEAPQEHAFSINGQVYDGQLTLSVSYNRAQYRDETVATLVAAFKAELEAVISHCSEGEQGVTPSDFPLANIKQVELDALPLTTSNLADLYPLSPMQSGMLFHSLYEPEGSAYLTQLCVDIDGVDVPKFKAAWQAVIARHDILRTGFIAQGDSHLQWVAKQVELPFTDIDWRKNNEQDVTQVARDDLAQGFNLAAAPLMRLTLVQLTDSKYHLVWTCHHLLLDGWSTSIVMGEVLRHYAGDSLPPITGHYRDYISWLVAQDSQATEAFWREQLTSLEAPTRLVNSLPPQETGVGYDEVTLAFDIKETTALNDFAKINRVTMNTLVQGAWSLLLSRYCGQNTVAFGGTVAGRPDSIAGINEQVGLFINTLPVIVNTNPAQKVGEWLQALQSQNITAREYEHTQLSDVQRWAGHGGEGIFDSIVVFENYPVAEALKAGAPDGLVFGETGSREETNYPLTLTVTYSDKLIVGFNYDSAHYDNKTIEQLSQHLSSVLVQLIVSESQSLGEINFISDSETKQLTQWGVNDTRYDNTQPVHQLIEQQVELTSDAIALVFEEQELTYQELNQRANQLAHYLIAQGVKPEDKVGIAVERSIEMVVSLLAVLKAGAAYVPLDPDYPNERLAYIMQDSGIKVLLSQSELLNNLPKLSTGSALCLDKLILSDEAVTNPDTHLHGDNLAYLIYTSGSTGKPKGVMVRHRALNNFLQSMQDKPGLTSEDTLVAVTSLSFDIAALELYLPLIAGAKLVLATREDVREGQGLAQLMEKSQATIFQSTPSGWRLLLASGWQPSDAKLKGLCGGEALPQDLAEELRSQGIELWNMYGPTETTIWSAVKQLSSDVPTLGQPIADTQVHILDNELNPTPKGVAGELYISGAGLARGYAGRVDLTTAAFIASPFSNKGEQLYRTGDLVHWNNEGELVYLGRIDHQVKIRGFRIELGEIETALLSQESVHEAVVIAQEYQGNARLVAYVATKDEGEIDTQQIQIELALHLPDYMVPSIIIVLDKLPQTPNGKIDRKTLPEPEFVSNNEYSAPIGEVEIQLALIWCEVLGIEQVGRHDNFFELGGDSILSLQIVARMGQMGWKISPKQLFENQTVASLASVASYDDSLNAEMQLSTNKLADYLNQDTLQKLSIQEDDFEDVYPLTSMQEGMFFHSLEAPGEGLYIKQLSVEVKVLDAQRLISAWQTMVDRHVILRTSILWNNEIERPLQLVRTSVTAMVNQQDWRDSNSLTENLRNYEAEELKYNIDFFNEPLARLALIRLSEDSYQLIWTMHHLLIDGWSDSKLIAEWLQTYAGKALPPVAPGFGQYVRWLEQQDPVVIESYWRGSLSRLDGPTLLADAIVSNEDGSGYNKLYLNWSEQQTVNLKNFAKQTRVTLNTVIQAAWALLLKQYTGQQHVVFGATVAGRPHNLPRSEDIFGLFINTLPVIVEPKAECLIGDYLRELQGSNAEIREYEHTPLADIQRWAGNSGKALFDSIVVFENYPIDKTLSEHQDGELQFGNITGEGLTGYAMDLQVIIEQTLEIEFCFDRADFSDQFVMQLRQQMDLLLKQMINNEQMPVGELCLFERQALSKLQTAHAHTAHNKGVLLTSDSFVHQIFEQHANAQPDKTALMLDDKALTYAQLNAKANVLAHQLIARGVGPDTVVAVASLRSAELIIALLAVLKAGGAYVPLDPGNPNERLNYIIKDSGAVLILGQASVLSELTVSSQVEKLYLDELELDPLLLEQADVANPIVELHPDNLAYVVYTSGSTGKPKGVAVAHGPLTMHCQSTADIYEMKSDWRELIFMSFSFDGAHERWLTTYSVGATLVVRGEELWTAEQTLSALSHYQVTNTTFPPAYLAQLAEAARDVDDIHKLKVCVFGGEAMPKSVYDNVRAILQPDVLINGYGPTETVVTPLIWKASKEQSFDTAYAPIGKAVGQRWLYILDDNLQPVPEGVIGELYVGGQGIARGYLSQSSLTAQNFIADPFTELGERMYRTGDLVRQLRDENIEFLGRADHQVKIRGYRIELGEVESAIRHIDLVADVAVIDKEINDNKQLVAYIVAHEQLDDASFSRSVRRQLEQQLPSYMVPSHFVVMSALPRLISGKLDRHGLPDDIQVTSSDYVEPSTPQAKEVAKIWQQVLNIEQVGETDNFFELGGDSLLSLKVISKLRSLGIDALNFKLRDLMQRPTIGGLLGLDNKKSPLLLMNAQQEGKAALFCLHAGMGTLFDYQPLANQLQGQRTLYGVPCRTFADPSYKDVSLEQMALDYCQMIREKQGQGPYALFGWSLGATLAAMVAALLEAAGQQVEFLGLVDSFIPDIKGLSLDAWQEDFVDYISVVLPQISTVQVNLVLDNVYPGHKQALLPDTLLLEATIAGLLAGLLADLTTKSAIKSVNESGISDEQELGYAALGSEGLMETFMMARHLKELSCQSITLPKLKVTPHYWWVAGRPESDKKELLALFAQDISQDFVLDTDHFSIIRDQRLITEVDNLLTTEHNKPLKEVKTLA